MLSLVQLSATPWTVACQAPLSMEFSRPESWSGKPFPSLGHLPNSGIEPRSPTLQADSLPAKPQGKPKNTRMGSLLPSPADIPNPGIEPGSPALQADSLPAEPPQKPDCHHRHHHQFTSVAQSCPTLCNPVNRSMPGLPVHHQLPESTQDRKSVV